MALFSFVNVQAYDLVKPSSSLRLYPEGQDTDRGIVEKGVAVTSGPVESNGAQGPAVLKPNGDFSNIGDEARIDIYLPKKCNGQMIVVCPGGAYRFCSSYNEGTRVADWCIKRNIAVCVLLYRMPYGHGKVPLTDVQNAFRYCRHHADEWGVKQIGVMGFSAGGHLAASASTLFVDDVTRPDFSVLVYPVISMETGVTHDETRRNITGGRRSLEPYYSLENQVSEKTPEALLLLCADDRAVPPENSIRYYRMMQKYGIPGELHILEKGGHGWGFSITEYGCDDKLGEARRADFFSTLERWLNSQAAKIEK